MCILIYHYLYVWLIDIIFYNHWFSKYKIIAFENKNYSFFINYEYININICWIIKNKDQWIFNYDWQNIEIF